MRKKVISIIVVAIILISFIILIPINRLTYGVWNPFETPSRLYYNNIKYYYIPNDELTGFRLCDNPTHKLPPTFLDILTGKQVFTDDESQDTPYFIYLRLNDGRFIPFHKPGGP